jgi:hypothetical protein
MELKCRIAEETVWILVEQDILRSMSDYVIRSIPSDYTIVIQYSLERSDETIILYWMTGIGAENKYTHTRSNLWNS